MAHNDTINPEFERLLKVDGHLGALYHPGNDTIRLVCKAGTVDINLNDIRRKWQKRYGTMQAQAE